MTRTPTTNGQAQMLTPDEATMQKTPKKKTATRAKSDAESNLPETV